MNGDEKFKFTLSLSINGCFVQEEFTLKELGYDPKRDKDIFEFLEKEWKEWRNDQLDGGYYLMEVSK